MALSAKPPTTTTASTAATAADSVQPLCRSRAVPSAAVRRPRRGRMRRRVMSSSGGGATARRSRAVASARRRSSTRPGVDVSVGRRARRVRGSASPSSAALNRSSSGSIGGGFGWMRGAVRRSWRSVGWAFGGVVAVPDPIRERRAGPGRSANDGADRDVEHRRRSRRSRARRGRAAPPRPGSRAEASRARRRRRGARRPRRSGRRRSRASPSVLGRDRSPPPPAGLVERGVRRDAVHPRREPRPTVEAVDAARDRDHRLLGGVERVFGMPEHAAADRVDLVDVALEQRFERGALAEGRATREVFVTAFVGTPAIGVRRRSAATTARPDERDHQTGRRLEPVDAHRCRGRCARRRRVRSCRRRSRCRARSVRASRRTRRRRAPARAARRAIRPAFLHPIDDEAQRLRAGAHLACRLDRAVGDGDDGLDRQHRSEHRLRAADATALAQVLERVDGEEDADSDSRADSTAATTSSQVAAVARDARGFEAQHADAHRRALRVDHRDRAHAVERLRGDLRRLHRRRHARRQVDAHDRVGAVVVQSRNVDSNAPTDGAAVSGSTVECARAAPRTPSVVSSTRSTSSSAPNRIVSGTISIPSSSQSAGGRSHALSLTIRTAIPTSWSAVSVIRRPDRRAPS